MKRKVEKVINQINSNLNSYAEPEYRIVEKSNKLGKYAYTVHSLEAELEDGEVYFGDMNNIIFNNHYALVGFLIDSVIDIVFRDKLIKIIFQSSSIDIELVN